MVKKKILFICKFNNTRSQIAAFLFNKYYTGSSWIADSAGIIGGRAQKETIDLLDELKRRHKMKFTKKKTLTSKMLFNSNQIIVVADDVPIEFFDAQKNSGINVSSWKVKDAWKYKNIPEKIDRLEKVYEDLDKKIKSFINKLDK